MKIWSPDPSYPAVEIGNSVHDIADFLNEGDALPDRGCTPNEFYFKRMQRKLVSITLRGHDIAFIDQMPAEWDEDDEDALGDYLQGLVAKYNGY